MILSCYTELVLFINDNRVLHNAEMSMLMLYQLLNNKHYYTHNAGN